ncbi:hypothetical protein M3194_05690 [Paenibacillus glycanilyticus]|nr:hypothetical protein [Paenibacillus glycanilyticus]MCM3626852.1 hypothetical protein [Paenibacillus glycanilyticus]
MPELLEDYGELFCVWFDGACGEGPNGKRHLKEQEINHAVYDRLKA